MKGSILVIDDIPDNLRLLEQTLTQFGYSVRNAISGKLALMGARADKPDLALLDIDMPGMDGYEICEAFQNDPLLSDIPIIFLSALGDSEHKVKAFRMGGVDYISKPFQVEEVLARVEHQLTIRQQQQQIEEQNQALELSNQRLEEFCHVVAHDLRQPLQSLLLSGEILDRRYGDGADALTQRHLRNIASSAQSMSQLMQGLLSYSLAGHTDQSWELISLDDVLSQAWSGLASAVQESQAQLHVESPLPILLGDSQLLLNLMQNLLSNALKFRQPDTVPQIRVTASQTDSAKISCSEQTLEAILPSNQSQANQSQAVWQIAVQDNGIGMATHECAAIFEIFRRFQDRDRYPGHGIGLSTCQKIVAHHGGEIWATSEVGQGSTLYFTMLGLAPSDSSQSF